MFDKSIIGVKDLEAVAKSGPALDSGAVGAATSCRDSLERRAALRAALHLEAEVACDEARSMRQGLHSMVRARGVDLPALAASRRDDI